jgi:hypothetical protein
MAMKKGPWRPCSPSAAGLDQETTTAPQLDDAEAKDVELIIARITAPTGYALVPGFEKADALLMDNDPLTGLGGRSTGARAPLPFTAKTLPIGNSAAPFRTHSGNAAPTAHPLGRWGGSRAHAGRLSPGHTSSG